MEAPFAVQCAQLQAGIDPQAIAAGQDTLPAPLLVVGEHPRWSGGGTGAGVRHVGVLAAIAARQATQQHDRQDHASHAPTLPNLLPSYAEMPTPFVVPTR